MKSVPFKPNGEPIDEEYTKYNRFFNGQELLIFDDFLEYAIFIGLINPNEEEAETE